MTWSVDSSRRLYNLPGWSGGYFDINGQGHMLVRANSASGNVDIDLPQLAMQIRAAGLSWPVLVRCSAILRDRVDQLYAGFSRACEHYDYPSGYTAIYPIKVNQQYAVVRELVDHPAHAIGLETGSKAELMAVLGIADAARPVVCNGYKDRDYIRLALIAARLGQRIYVVIEKLSELRLLIEQSRELSVKPLVGVRVRLASIGEGKWQNSGGDKSKFGLNADQLLALIDELGDAGMLDCLQLLHFHLGSQVAKLQDIQNALAEAAHFYAELHAAGAPVNVVDTGGGLGVDYDGSASRNPCSINYSLDQYAESVVMAIGKVCRERNLPFPQLFSESGRALTAHHALLITNVIDTERIDQPRLPDLQDSDMPPAVSQVRNLRASAPQGSPLETWHELQAAMQNVQSAYSAGEISLPQRAAAERYYFATLRCLQERLQPGHREHRPLLDELNEKLADKYFCNFSVFRSLPDVWGIEQLFPVVPLARLDEQPQRRAVLQDLTCDSDGRIGHYVDGEGVESSLPVHALIPGESYLLGVFLVGAYQEILGDLHNLFGRTDTVNLEIDADGCHRLVRAERGERADQVLRHVDFDPGKLRQVYRQRVQQASLDEAEARLFLAELEAGLVGYTYLTD